MRRPRRFIGAWRARSGNAERTPGRPWFQSRLTRYPVPIASDTVQQQIALLRILVGCGDKALEAFQAVDNPLDTEFVTDLERIIERSRDELAALVEKVRAAS